jgi:hypothetical protein
MQFQQQQPPPSSYNDNDNGESSNSSFWSNLLFFHPSAAAAAAATTTTTTTTTTTATTATASAVGGTVASNNNRSIINHHHHHNSNKNTNNMDVQLSSPTTTVTAITPQHVQEEEEEEEEEENDANTTSTLAETITTVVARGGIVPQKAADELLAQELNQLSMKEREDIYLDIHGVAEEGLETLDLMERSIDAMKAQLWNNHQLYHHHHHPPHHPLGVAAGQQQQQQPQQQQHQQQQQKEHQQAYEQALSMNEPFVHDRTLLIQLLRADRWNIMAAVDRMYHFWTAKLQLFGVLKLTHAVTLTDCYSHNDDDGWRCLVSGFWQLLPGRDRSGRAILFCAMSLRPTYTNVLPVVSAVGLECDGCACWCVGVELFLCVTVKKKCLSDPPLYFVIDLKMICHVDTIITPLNTHDTHTCHISITCISIPVAPFVLVFNHVGLGG